MLGATKQQSATKPWKLNAFIGALNICLCTNRYGSKSQALIFQWQRQKKNEFFCYDISCFPVYIWCWTSLLRLLLVLVWMLFMCLVTWDKITLLIKMIMVCAHGHTQTKTAFYWRSFEAINSRTWDSKNSVCSICECLFLCLIIWKAHKNDAQQESK